MAGERCLSSVRTGGNNFDKSCCWKIVNILKREDLLNSCGPPPPLISRVAPASTLPACVNSILFHPKALSTTRASVGKEAVCEVCHFV